jgi:hypothetical protein
MSTRLDELRDWLSQSTGSTEFRLEPASSDASFRRYFRVFQAGRTFIVMDAPPEREDCRPYVTVATAFRAAGLNVPEILGANLDKGFMLLTDLGSRLYLDALERSTANRLYDDALNALLRLQTHGTGKENLLPAYNHELLMRELNLFRDWYIGTHLGLVLDDVDNRILDEVFAHLIQSALEQPRVWVHRDYHSRNLMVTTESNPGILDFQDAVTGPVTYDVVSLLRDCYIAWPAADVERWARQYYDGMKKAGLLSGTDWERFLSWFDLMGIQRHLKATGIFARLSHRDGKPGYLNDIPRTLGYVLEVCGRYPDLRALDDLLQEIVVPRLGS